MDFLDTIETCGDRASECLEIQSDAHVKSGTYADRKPDTAGDCGSHPQSDAVTRLPGPLSERPRDNWPAPDTKLGHDSSFAGQSKRAEQLRRREPELQRAMRNGDRHWGGECPKFGLHRQHGNDPPAEG